MSVAKVIEIISTSEKSFADAIETGVKRASKTVKNLQSAWVADQEVLLKGGKVNGYRVRLKCTFILTK
jgi:hypothetical protein